MARPSKLTPEIIEEILGYVRAGNHFEPAARACGVPASTFWEWMRKGETAPGAHGETQLDDMSVTDLRGLLVSNGIEIPKRAKRQQLVDIAAENDIGGWDRYRAFRESLDEAEALAEVRAVTQWNVHFEKTPGEIARFLARRQPSRWADMTRVQIGGGDEPIAVDVNVSVEQDAVRKMLVADPEAARLLDELSHKLEAAAAAEVEAAAS